MITSVVATCAHCGTRTRRKGAEVVVGRRRRRRIGDGRRRRRRRRRGGSGGGGRRRCCPSREDGRRTANATTSSFPGRDGGEGDGHRGVPGAPRVRLHPSRSHRQRVGRWRRVPPPSGAVGASHGKEETGRRVADPFVSPLLAGRKKKKKPEPAAKRTDLMDFLSSLND
jgi:hypothetical protein